MKKCFSCGEEMQDGALECSHCGELVHDVETDVPPTPVYLPVSLTKLIVMSIFTLGLYQIYWFYTNWRLIRENERLKINVGLRAIFPIFFCYSLFKRIFERAKSLDLITSANAGGLSVGWIVFAYILIYLPDPFRLLSFSSVLFLLPAQRASNAVNELLTPGYDRNTRFRPLNILLIVIGGMFWFLAVIGTFLPPVPE